MNYQELNHNWQAILATGGDLFLPITDNESLERVTRALEELDRTMQEEGHPHPLAEFSNLVMHRIVAYENEHHPIDDSEVSGAQMLASLMEERELSQRQLAKETGIQQSTISQLINGKREFTADHIRRLSKYFKCNPSLFI